MDTAYERGRASAEDYPEDDTAELEADVRAILDEMAELAEKLGRRMLRMKVVDRWTKAYTDDLLGYQPSRLIAEESIIDDMRSDARDALSAWLTDELKEAVELS